MSTYFVDKLFTHKFHCALLHTNGKINDLNLSLSLHEFNAI